LRFIGIGVQSQKSTSTNKDGKTFFSRRTQTGANNANQIWPPLQLESKGDWLQTIAVSNRRNMKKQYQTYLLLLPASTTTARPVRDA